MYPGRHAIERADQPAFVMANTGAVVTYREFEARANRVAHLLANLGLERFDHFSIFMENNDRYLEVCSAGERSGTPLTTTSAPRHSVNALTSRRNALIGLTIDVAATRGSHPPYVTRWCVAQPALNSEHGGRRVWRNRPEPSTSFPRSSDTLTPPSLRI